MITVIRLFMRETQLREEIVTKITDAVRTGRADASTTKGAEIQQLVQTGFDRLKARIAGAIDEETPVIDGSLQEIVARKQERTYSADQGQQSLEQTGVNMRTILHQLRGTVV